MFGAEQLDPDLKVGLVGHWIGGLGSGLAWEDRTGYQNHAAFVGAPKWVLSRTQDRSALQFPTASDYVSASASATLNNLGALTVSAWVYGTDFSHVQSIISKFNAAATTGWVLQVGTAGDIAYYRFGTTGPNDNGYFSNTGAIIANTWMHVAFVTPGAGTSGAIYVNGVLQTLATNTPGGATSDDSATALWIGNQQPTPTAFWAGVLDDVRLYNRALVLVDIERLASPSFLPVIPARSYQRGIR